jgi:hypothetical protein
MNHATVSMDMSYLPPSYSCFVLFAARSHCVIFGFVHINTSLAQVEFGFFLGINIFSFKESCVLPLVLEILLITSKNDPALQLSRHFCLLEVPFPVGPHKHKIVPRTRFEK